ncbi:MAG: leucine-rich repeat domain-containing protein, partial [Planctomycetaceae bacterium]|nr:leucine-rich repeat domain-containing protein [Planctomycetaceae bacterium]
MTRKWSQATPAEAYDEALRRIEQVRSAGGTRLDLHDLPLASIPPEIGELTGLEWLLLGIYKLCEHADAILDFDFERLALKQFSDLTSLKKLTTLHVVDLSWCTQITDVSSLGMLTQLRRLSLSNCSQIMDVSPLGMLTQLTHLDLSHCSQITDVSHLGKLTQLTRLKLSGDWQITDVSPLSKLTQLSQLHLRGCSQITGVSPFGKLEKLTQLDLSECTQIKDVSPLGELTQLTHLDLSWCTQITDVSPLGKLTQLIQLNLSWCSQITDVSSLGMLTQLRRLYLSNCSQITDMTPLGKFTQLEQINLSGCPQITDAMLLSKLVQLKQIDLSEENGITDPTPLINLSSLKDLKLNHRGDCGSFAPWRGLLDRLDDLSLAGSRFPDLPASCCVWEALPHVRAHYADLDHEATLDTELKVFILGNGSVGKTQLCRRLQGLDFDDSIETTHGIQLGHCNLDQFTWPGHTDAAKVRLNLWDFGGQDIYHGSHAHFIESRSIFLILWTPETETGEYVDGHGLNMRHHPLSYWLDYVRTLAGDACPLFVVQSQCDERATEKTPSLSHSAQMPSPKTFACSAKTGRGLDTLRGVLRDATRDLFEREGVTPLGGGRQRLRMKLRDLVEQESLLPAPQRKHRTIDRQTFAAWCGEASGISNVDAMLSFLDTSGVVFHRPGMFQDRIILDQNWAFEAIYALFRRDDLFPRLARDGRFRLADLDQVWESYTRDERKLFLDVMLECGICFRGRCLKENAYDHTDYEYIAPELLPEWHDVRRERLRRLEDNVPTVRATARFEFLHDGVLRRLLAK